MIESNVKEGVTTWQCGGRSSTRANMSSSW